MKGLPSENIKERLEYAKQLSKIQPEEFLEISYLAYKEAKDNHLKEEEGLALLNLAMASKPNGDISKMLRYSFEALGIFEDLHLAIGQVRALNIIAITYSYCDMYEEALRYLLKGIQMLSHNNNPYLMGCILNNIAEVYRKSGDLEQANHYYFRGLEVCLEHGFDLNTASIYNSISDLLFEKEEFEEALRLCFKSYEILADDNDMLLIAETENRIGKIYAQYNNSSLAESFYAKALHRMDILDNRCFSIDILLNMGMLYQNQDFEETIKFFEHALELADELGNKEKLGKICKVMADCYELKFDYKTALEYYRKYTQCQNEIMTLNMSHRLELIRIEIEHFKGNAYENIQGLLEMEIINQNNELKKIKAKNERLEKKIVEDPLTGLYNRRFIKYNLIKRWNENKKRMDVVSLFILDIDYFKKYNDFWGHLKGDECLVKVIKSIQQIKKHTDYFIRYGGEEFIYYSVGMSYEEAISFGNEIRQVVEDLKLHFEENGQIRFITMSIGGVIGEVGQYDKFKDMLQCADEELYRAKSMGRNMLSLRSALRLAD